MESEKFESTVLVLPPVHTSQNASEFVSTRSNLTYRLFFAYLHTHYNLAQRIHTLIHIGQISIIHWHLFQITKIHIISLSYVGKTTIYTILPIVE